MFKKEKKEEKKDRVYFVREQFRLLSKRHMALPVKMMEL